MKKRKIGLILSCGITFLFHFYLKFMEYDFDLLMEHRRLQVQDYCVKDGFSERKDYVTKNIMNLESLKVSWCPVSGASDIRFYQSLLLSKVRFYVDPSIKYYKYLRQSYNCHSIFATCYVFDVSGAIHLK